MKRFTLIEVMIVIAIIVIIAAIAIPNLIAAREAQMKAQQQTQITTPDVVRVIQKTLPGTNGDVINKTIKENYYVQEFALYQSNPSMVKTEVQKWMKNNRDKRLLTIVPCDNGYVIVSVSTGE
jgi:prepilin-type N-terminal cleavage/methylation domain-containing protein